MEVTGQLHVVFDTQETSASFRKRDFVLMIADNPQYPQYVQFQLTQAKCEILDSISVGSEVSVMFNLRGRAWTNPQGETKYFNQLEAWNIKVSSSQSTPQAPQVPQGQTQAPVINVANGGGDSFDLPF